MQQDAWKRHAESFGDVATEYDAARPTYPPAAVDWLAGPPPRDVLDLGAGTGKLTGLLAAAGHRVTAVDPSAGMLGQLRQRLPHVTAVVGDAERVPLPASSVDVVTVAQAWHWFDQELATAECVRVLRPGGRLALVWNQRDESVAWLRAAWEPLNRDGSTGMGLLDQEWQAALATDPDLVDGQEAVFRHEQTLTREQLLLLAGSRSSVAVQEPEARRSVLAEVAAVLDTHPDTRGRATLVLPYETRCFAWTRR